MPAYSSDPTSTRPILHTGYAGAVWSAEQPLASSPLEPASRALSLHRDPNLPNAFSVEVEFAADPGAFQIDVQLADTDADKYYVTKASLTSGLNADFVGRIEVTSAVAKFVRLLMVSQANAVNVTAKIF